MGSPFQQPFFHCTALEKNSNGNGLKNAVLDMLTHADALPFLPYRCRDNIVGLYFNCQGFNLDNLRNLFEDIHGLKLQCEAEGRSLTTLESIVSLPPPHTREATKIQWKHRNPPTTRQEQTIVRFVDYHSINCRCVLQGMVPNMIIKCFYYTATPHDTFTIWFKNYARKDSTRHHGNSKARRKLQCHINFNLMRSLAQMERFREALFNILVPRFPKAP